MKVYKVTYQTFKEGNTFAGSSFGMGYNICTLEKIFSTKEKAEEFRTNKQNAAIELGLIGYLTTNIIETTIE